MVGNFYSSYVVQRRLSVRVQIQGIGKIPLSPPPFVQNVLCGVFCALHHYAGHTLAYRERRCDRFSSPINADMYVKSGLSSVVKFIEREFVVKGTMTMT